MAGFDECATSACAHWSRTLIDGAAKPGSINKVQPSNRTLALVAIAGIRVETMEPCVGKYLLSKILHWDFGQ
jgi:hypothetical protein